MSRLSRSLLLLPAAGALIVAARHISRRNGEQQQPLFADAHVTPEPVIEPVVEPAEARFVAGVQDPAAEEVPAAGPDTWSGRAIDS